MDIMIKNMVCRHCMRAVETILEKLGIHNAEIMLGTVRIPDEELAGISLEDLDRELEADGFERISDRNAMIVENIKKTIIRHVRIERECPRNLSACLEKHLDITYDTASRIFSAQEGRTIEKYFIAQKIELVKELMGYNQMSISEIADLAGYSSVSHLSRQFKEVTGLTPSQYLRQGENDRRPITQV
ncbi:MAG: helix-turn-helix domain-containing protein [Muribaculaceae bacterium]|nr:helix-turn-helix domain-containing protein [Muribaculaceae bacterium]